MNKREFVVVVCVDRDNDLGRKTGIEGPLIGRQENLHAAIKLALADPTESDANSIFAAIQKYDQIKDQFPKVELLTLTGASKFGFESDKKINEQLDDFLEKNDVDAFVLVTDGAEDDQILPILQSRANILSKETVIIKQAKEVEGTYYAVKEALKDPFLARMVFGIPGLMLLIFVLLPSIGLQLVMLVAGMYLILKGFGLEERLSEGVKSVASSFSQQRLSFPFYIGAALIFAFGLTSAYDSILSAVNAYYTGDTAHLASSASTALDFLIFFTLLAGIAFLIGKALDSVQLKKAYQLRNHVLAFVSIILLAFILGAAKSVLIGETNLNGFLTVLITSFAAYFLVLRASNILDVRKKITKLLVGLPVYSAKGKRIGKVEGIDRESQTIHVKIEKGTKAQKLEKREFTLREGKIVLAQ
ncbi:MAG: DUF373 family protein [Candidatus Diapherotrites archaeon]|nr:DUF373 family protein [Candidatus Diapherotrites archaeon]